MNEQEDRERFRPALVAAPLIRRPGGKILFVMKKDRWTIPTEHFEVQEEDDIEGTIRRGAKEELGISPEEISIREFLGPFIRNKDSPHAKNLEIVYCRVSHKVAEKIRFQEAGENRQGWFNPWQAKRLPNFDELAKEAVSRYLERNCCRRVSAKVCLFGNLRRKLLWRGKEDFQEGMASW